MVEVLNIFDNKETTMSFSKTVAARPPETDGRHEPRPRVSELQAEIEVHEAQEHTVIRIGSRCARCIDCQCVMRQSSDGLEVHAS